MTNYSKRIDAIDFFDPLPSAASNKVDFRSLTLIDLNYGKLLMKRFFSTFAALCLVGTWVITSTAGAQDTLIDYPNKAVTVIVSFPPGGSSDYFTRLVAREMSQAWGRPVVVENRPGAGGNIGAQAASRAAPDGYTLYLGSIATNAINASIYKNPGYDHTKDFVSISKIATVTNVLVVNPNVPARTVNELLAHVKKDSKNAFYASPGAGTSPHLSMELFKALTGTQISHVAYKGSAPALIDVMSGQVPMTIDNLPSALPLIKAGKLRALAVTSTGRSVDLPDVPTMIESGIVGYDVTSWWGLFAPAHTPEKIIKKINIDILKAFNTVEVKANIAKQGAMSATSTPAELERFVIAETARWEKIIKSSGITQE